MSAYAIAQSVTCGAIELRIRSIEGNVLCLEASDGSFFGYRHASSVEPIECTPAADAVNPPAGLVAQSLSVQGCACGVLASVLTTEQAEAVYSAMRVLNNVGGALSVAVEGIRVEETHSGAVQVWTLGTIDNPERHANQTAFAAAYGLS